MVAPGQRLLAAGHDGETMWFTGKTSCSVGRINPDGSVEHFPLVSDCGPGSKSAPTFLSRNRLRESPASLTSPASRLS